MSATSFVAITVAVAFAILYLNALRRAHELRAEQVEQRKKAELAAIRERERSDLAAVRERELRKKIGSLAMEQLEAWKQSELVVLRAREQELAYRHAQTLLQEWREQSTTAIRQDAIQRSRSVIAGQVTEHLLPLMPIFPFNPKDAKFIGSPIDLLVFDGLQEDDVRRIIFLEVKIGAAGLSPRQRQIRDVIRAGKVEWLEMRLDAPPALLPAIEVNEGAQAD
jgi:predicted Holliday junction resolvase-like endonuclease